MPSFDCRPSQLALVLLALAAPATLVAQDDLRGGVYDAYSRAPLAGVRVSGNGAEATTDASGNFRIACRSGLKLTFTATGYARAERTVSDCSAQLLVGLGAGTQDLNAVHVVATREAPGMRQPASTSTLARPVLTRSTGLFLDDALATVPGVFLERRTMSGGQRVTIRGYGNRTNFDGSGYKAYLNGMPITDAEGVTMLDDIDFATLGQVDVVRGPSSSLYGAGIAGVLNLATLRPERAGTTIEQSMLSGADGLVRNDTRYMNVSSGATMLANYGHQSYDSYRVHSASTKDHVMLLGDFRPSDRRTITAFLTWAHSFDERAGQLDSAQFFGRQNVGETPYLNNDGHVDMESVRAAVTHSLRLNDHVEPSVTGYFSGVSREDIFAVGVNPRSNQTFGARAVVKTHFLPGGRAVTGVTGAEFERTNQFAKGYPLNNQVQGGVTTDLETHTMQYNVFSQWTVALPSAFTVTVGASLDFIEYAIEDRLTNTANPAHRDLTGRKTYDPVLIPSIALQRMLGEDHSVYVSYGTGFTPSTSSDAVIPFTGEPNRGLKPERGAQLELGAKGRAIGGRLSYQLALFQLDVNDKLVAQGVFDTLGTQLYSYTTNAGDQRNRGLEAALSYAALARAVGPVVSLQPFLSAAWSDFQYTHFASDNNDNAQTRHYDGKSVVGVPKLTWTLGADAGFRAGIYANATAQHRDAMPITYDNAHEAPAFTILNAKVGVRRDLGTHFDLDAFVGGQNLTGELHYTMVFLNANFAGAPPAIYLPGPYEARAYAGFVVRVTP